MTLYERSEIMKDTLLCSMGHIAILYRPTPSSLCPRTVGSGSVNKYNGSFYTDCRVQGDNYRLRKGQKLIYLSSVSKHRAQGAGAIGQVPSHLLGTSKNLYQLTTEPEKQAYLILWACRIIKRKSKTSELVHLRCQSVVRSVDVRGCRAVVGEE